VRHTVESAFITAYSDVRIEGGLAIGDSRGLNGSGGPPASVAVFDTRVRK
jgi:hypothetical protein